MQGSWMVHGGENQTVITLESDTSSHWKVVMALEINSIKIYISTVDTIVDG